MTKKNRKIREAAFLADVPLWKVAELLGMRPESLSRKMRYELPEDEQQRIINVIKENAGAYHDRAEE